MICGMSRREIVANVLLGALLLLISAVPFTFLAVAGNSFSDTFSAR
jgi:hypothetical protein